MWVQLSKTCTTTSYKDCSILLYAMKMVYRNGGVKERVLHDALRKIVPLTGCGCEIKNVLDTNDIMERGMELGMPVEFNTYNGCYEKSE